MANWYTSDPHFGHENIIALCNRPFKSVAEMDEAILHNLASRVGPDDDLWIIGDFSLGQGGDGGAHASSMFSRIPGRKHLVVGNHDGKKVLRLPWTSISPLAEIRDGTQRLVLCHYPMITWHKARHGALQLFGHVHNQWQGSRNSINVGVDVWDYAPVQLGDIHNRAATLAPNKHWADVEHGAGL